MIDKPLMSITAADIQRLVADGTTEGRRIEFKRELPGAKDSDRKEFLADVSSFTNATGGDLVYGVATTNGRATAADGLIVTNLDGELLRLDQMIRSGISPRIVGCHLHAVPGLTKGPAIVIRVPRSWQGPHIVSYQQHFRFFSRNANGKFPMDVTDIRDAVLNAGSTEDRIRLFRADRLARIAAGETPVRLDGTKLTCVHVVPFQAYSGAGQVDLHLAANHTELLQPLLDGGWSAPTFNIDGVYTHSASGDGSTSDTYLQCFRSGILEAVESAMIPSPSGYPEAVPSTTFANSLFSFVKRAMELLKVLDVVPPVAVLVSLVGAKGVPLGVRQSDWRVRWRPIDRDVLLLPDVLIDDASVEVSELLKPILDGLWQSVGAPRCYEYDDAGKWCPR